MHIKFPRTRWTREVFIELGRNADKNPTFGFTALDDTDFVLLTVYFDPWCWPGIISYNGPHGRVTVLAKHKPARPFFNRSK